MVDQETGVALIAIGFALIVIGLFLSFLGPVCGLGIVLLVVGVIIAAVGQPRPVYYQAPPGAYPAVAASTYPCPVCRSPLTWVPQYGRWWCGTCQAYR